MIMVFAHILQPETFPNTVSMFILIITNPLIVQDAVEPVFYLSVGN